MLICDPVLVGRTTPQISKQDLMFCFNFSTEVTGRDFSDLGKVYKFYKPEVDVSIGFAVFLTTTGVFGELASQPSLRARRKYFRLIWFLMACFISGNSLILAAIGINEELRTATNYFLFSLAVGDLFLCLLYPTHAVSFTWFLHTK